MRANSVKPSFDGVTIVFHWITVGLVLAAFGAGLAHEQLHGPSVEIVLAIHRLLGLCIYLVTAFRLVWRRTGAYLPPFPDSLGAFHRLVVKLNEYALYAFLFLQPLTGLAQSVYRGKQIDLFLWQLPVLAQRDKAAVVFFHQLHEFGAIGLALLIGGHASAALVHHLILRDEILTRIVPGIEPRRQARPKLCRRAF